jgi:hypothetical protein
MATDNHGTLFRCNEILKSVQVGGTITLKSRNYFPGIQRILPQFLFSNKS